MPDYPQEMTPALREVLGLMVFTTGPIAQAFRAAGEDIARKAEAEHAYVLHWLIGLALEHGDDWKPKAAAQLDALKAKIAARQAAAHG